jgi:beta-galactosidase
VMDETFDMWTEPKSEADYSQSFPEWWQADVDAMVIKDRNHPCVIMYSIGNEIPDTGRPSGAAPGRAIAERIRALDDTRLVTNSINPMLSVGMDVIATLAGGIDAVPTKDTGINTMMSMMEQFLPIILQHEVVDERTAESYAYLDVAGYNYAESRYAIDHELHPHRVIVGSENRPPSIVPNWQLVSEHPHVIGDFTWTGWDYLGEAGIGRAQYASEELGGFMGDYPWLTAHCGDFDITGHRRPVSHWREIVWGRRNEPYVAVRPPSHHGEATSARSGWSFTDAIASWSWPGFEEQPVTVEVYADADEVELLVNGTPVGRAPSGEDHGYRTEFETTYVPGDLTVVSYCDGAETGRTSLHSATGPVALDVRADRALIDADDRDLAYVEITLVDADGNLHGKDRAVTVAIEGPGVLQGFGSGNPCTAETFGSPTHDTYHGRALAVVRPTGTGTITVAVSSEGCDDRWVTIEAATP